MRNNLSRVMTTEIIAIGVDDSIDEAFRIMRTHRIRHLPVREKGEFVGILSDRDVQRALHVEIFDFNSGKIALTDIDPLLRVRDFMSQPVVKVPASTELVEVAQRMIDDKISSVLVTEGESVVVGILTSEDLLRVLVRLLEKQRTHMPRVSPLFELAYNSPVSDLARSLSASGV